MNIQEAKEEIKAALQAYTQKDETGMYVYPPVRQRPILLMGPPGIGKTAIMEQIAAECGVGLVSYTMTHHTRQSAIGLPRIVQTQYRGRAFSVTEYTLSEMIASLYECEERTGKREGILFIDEINCVSETLAPVMLQLLQSKRFGKHAVPEGWVIVAAGNPPEYNKSVRDFDMVTLDRVRRIDVEASARCWLSYAQGAGIHGAVTAYLQLHPDRFYSVRREKGEKYFVTARGWEDLSRLLQSYEQAGREVKESLVTQFLQDPAQAAYFAAYYRIYMKYGRDFGVRALLSADGPVRCPVPEQASLEERITAVVQTGSVLREAFAACRSREDVLERLRGLKRSYEGWTQEPEDFIASRMQILETQREAQILSFREEHAQRQAIRLFLQADETARMEHRTRPADLADALDKLCAREEAAAEREAEKIRSMAERAFDMWKGRQEMTLLVSSLARDPDAARFLARCPAENWPEDIW